MISVNLKLNEVFQQVFQNATLAIRPETTADDIAGWDSVMHVSLVLAVEQAFQVRFTSSEIANLQSVGDLINLITTKQSR